MLSLHIYSLALDAAKFLPRQLEIFEKLDRPWHWHIIEGVADSVLDTSWVAKIPPRLSRDGTSEWLNSKLGHPHISIHRRQLWPGKNAMVNAALMTIKEPCCLMQIDADEFWTAAQLENIAEIYDQGGTDRMRFFCRYFVGENIVVTTEGLFANRIGEWSRSWLFAPGMTSSKHEPPILNGCGKREMTREQTREMGLTFDHEAYKYEEQLVFKEKYYKYPGALAGWKKLQENKVWPTKLKPFFNWVEPGVEVNLVENT